MIAAIKNQYEKPIEVVEGSQEKAEKVNEIKESIDERRNSLAEELWDKFKKKENFDKFIQAVETETGLSFYFYDTMTPAPEKNQQYVRWLEHQKIN